MGITLHKINPRHLIQIHKYMHTRCPKHIHNHTQTHQLKHIHNHTHTLTMCTLQFQGIRVWLARTTSAIGCTALRFSAKYPKWTREPTLILSWCVTNKLNVHRSCDNVSVCTFSSTQSPIRSSPIKAECERMIFPWGLRISPADPVAESLVMTHVKSWCVKIIVNHAA